MTRILRPAALILVLSLTAACGARNASSVLPLPVTPNANGDSGSFFLSDFHLPANVRAACAGPAPAGFARCIALVRTDGAGAYLTANSSAYGPADLQAAYALPSSADGHGQTVAIVDAMNDPTALADLTKYRATYRLSACTAIGHCFTRVNQLGSPNGPFPPNNAGWAQEISLDLDMVSAICSNCHILLVEAKSASFNDLAASVDTAARLGANAISNSYGGSEFGGETSAQSHYNHPGVMITASSGDSGYDPQFPAARVAPGNTSGHFVQGVDWGGVMKRIPGCGPFSTQACDTQKQLPQLIGH